jgi:hypothetical protein
MPSHRLPSLGVAIAIFAALLILFAWLHLMVSMQISSVNRLILQKEEELERLERDTEAIMLKVAREESPGAMKQRGDAAGYVKGDRIYIELTQPLVQEMEMEEGQQVPAINSAPVPETEPSRLPALLESVFGSSKSGTQAQR